MRSVDSLGLTRTREEAIQPEEMRKGQRAEATT
jgi:hypothetical protein